MRREKALTPEQLRAEVEKYRRLIDERLQVDLKQTLDLRDAVYDRMAEYHKLKTTIEQFRVQKLKEIKTLVDVGCNFFAEAKCADISRIYVDIGFGFHAELTWEEALCFVEKKTALLSKQAEVYTTEASEIRGRIKLVLEAINELINTQ